MYKNISSWFYQILSIYFQWPLMPVSKSSSLRTILFFPDRTLLKTKERCLIYIYKPLLLSISVFVFITITITIGQLNICWSSNMCNFLPLFTGSLMFIFWLIKWKSLFSPRMGDSPQKCQLFRCKRESVR